MAPVSSPSSGWGNYVLFTREAGPNEPVALAVAASCQEALDALLPGHRIVAAPPGGWLIAAKDAEGRHHVVVPTRSRRIPDQTEAWEKFTPVAQRVASKLWAQIDGAFGHPNAALSA